jgi:hypothetical protein
MLDETIEVALATSVAFLSALCPPLGLVQESATAEELEEWFSAR